MAPLHERLPHVDQLVLFHIGQGTKGWEVLSVPTVGVMQLWKQVYRAMTEHCRVQLVNKALKKLIKLLYQWVSESWTEETRLQ